MTGMLLDVEFAFVLSPGSSHYFLYYFSKGALFIPLRSVQDSLPTWSFLLGGCRSACRYSAPYTIQPVLIRGSQSDWMQPSEWSMPALKETLKTTSVFLDTVDCMIEDLDIIDGKCHFVKSGRTELAGKEWAALQSVNITGLGVTTYSELFDAQVGQPRDQYRWIIPIMN
jgi:hypothetical protein